MTETETTKFKKSLAELDQGLISLAAMLNKHGQAELRFGIAPNGKPVGQEINGKTQHNVSQKIAARIEPRIYPEITQQTAVGKRGCADDNTGNDGDGVKTPATGKTQQKILDQVLAMLRQTPAMSAPELALQLNKSESAIYRAIRALRESGRLQRIGPDKGGHWEVID